MAYDHGPWIGFAHSALPAGARSWGSAANRPASARPASGFDPRPRDIPSPSSSPQPADAPDRHAPTEAGPAASAAASIDFNPIPSPLPASPSLPPDPGHATSLAEAAGHSGRASAAGVQPWRLQCFAKARHLARVGFALFGHACASVLYAATWMAPVGTKDVYEASAYNLRQVWAGLDGAPPAGRTPVPAGASDSKAVDTAGGIDAASASPAGEGRFAGLLARMKQAQEKYKLAVDKAKVDFAKKAFYMKCLDVALGATAVAVAVAVTVMTGGAALAIPAVIVTGVLLYWAVADWNCARHNLQAAREGRAQLPMGGNALANTLYRYHTEVQGMAPEQARWESTVTSGITSAMVAAVSLAMGVAISVPVRIGISITRYAISIFYRLHSMGEFGLARALASRQREIGRSEIPEVAGIAPVEAMPLLPRSLDSDAFAPLLELLKEQGLVAAPMPERSSSMSESLPACASGWLDEPDIASEVGDDDPLDSSEAGLASGSADASEESDAESVGDGGDIRSVTPPVVTAPAPSLARVLTRREGDLLTRWVQRAPSFDPLTDVLAAPSPEQRRQRFEDFLAELVRKDEEEARLARLGQARFVGVNSIYLASFLRGFVTFCLAR